MLLGGWRGVNVRHRGALAGLVACLATNLCVAADDLLERWAARTARIDSLYVEARIDERYRVPVGADPTDQSKWVLRKSGDVLNYRLWLRRPDFRIEVDIDYNTPELHNEVIIAAWLDGRAYDLGGRPDAPETMGGIIQGYSRPGRLKLDPYLTPLEYHFFEYPIDDAPRHLARLPHRIEDNVATIEISKHEGWSWIGRLEFDPNEAFPRRMMLIVGEKQPLITWSMYTLETTMVEGVRVISKALLTLRNPRALPDMLALYIWEATCIEKRPITRADLEVIFPEGTHVTDYVENRSWVVGQPDSVEEFDPNTLRTMARWMRAGLLAPEIRARRQRAMLWIVGAGAAATAGALLLLRRRRAQARGAR